MSKDKNCFFCGSECETYPVPRMHSVKDYKCKYCGSYLLDDYLIKCDPHINETKNKFKIACVLNERRLKKLGGIALNDKTNVTDKVLGLPRISVDDILNEFPKKASDFLNRTLLNLSRLPEPPFDVIKLNTAITGDRLQLFTPDRQGCYGFLRELAEQGLIRFNQVEAGPQWDVFFRTIKFWEKVENLKKEEVGNKKPTARDTSFKPESTLDPLTYAIGGSGSQMSYIFISYSHKDKEYAHRLEKALRRRGFEVWLDDRIDYGSKWPKTIENKLDGCEALILIMTAHSDGSDWVQNELARANRKRKNIFPLLLEGEPWLSVEATQYVDVRGGDLPLTTFYDTLAKVVPRKDVGASEQIEVKPTSEAATPTDLFKDLPPSFRNPFELDAEYILIPGGRYKYQGKTEKEVPNIYFAKYPVTNKRYRRFIRYLEEKEHELLEILPKREFNRRMTEFASGNTDFGKHLGDRPNSWPEKLRSEHDTTKDFNGEDQPVVGVSWFNASAYCYWLSLLEAAHSDLPVDKVANLYRLPREIEWEWASGGGKREYPWLPEKGPPTDKLANYNLNVGVTTPVGRYPDGATPDGLMDMVGNVWEWMENWHEEYEGKYRSLRGGSCQAAESILRCSYCRRLVPRLRVLTVGFRVVRSQS